MAMIATDKLTIVVGLGTTGLSCARFLARQGVPFVVVDTRDNPPGLTELRAELPDIEVRLGALDGDFLAQADQLIVSPGLNIASPAISQARTAGVTIRGDIDLFHQYAQAPIVAITGSNGKSTVTTLVADMARDAGRRVAVGGNLGTPALDLLAEEIELYVLELSSFQLETTTELGALAATVLNVSEDHMDRYPSLHAYYLAKHRIFQNCTYAIVNKDDALSVPLVREGMRVIAFATKSPSYLQDFGLLERDGELHLALGFEALMPVRDLKMAGRHNYSNALAALALGQAADLPLDSMLATLRRFTGLPHRCQWVGEKSGVRYIDDSKGTNVGATLAAIRGLGQTGTGRLVLIAGGDGKGADFSPLREPLQRWARAVVLMGRDALLLRSALAAAVTLEEADSMADAVRVAATLAQPGDLVLLSPACASLDMFRNYEDRGQQFAQAVRAL